LEDALLAKLDKPSKEHRSGPASLHHQQHPSKVHKESKVAELEAKVAQLSVAMGIMQATNASLIATVQSSEHTSDNRMQGGLEALLARVEQLEEAWTRDRGQTTWAQQQLKESLSKGTMALAAAVEEVATEATRRADEQARRQRDCDNRAAEADQRAAASTGEQQALREQLGRNEASLAAVAALMQRQEQEQMQTVVALKTGLEEDRVRTDARLVQFAVELNSGLRHQEQAWREVRSKADAQFTELSSSVRLQLDGQYEHLAKSIEQVQRGERDHAKERGLVEKRLCVVEEAVEAADNQELVDQGVELCVLEATAPLLRGMAVLEETVVKHETRFGEVVKQILQLQQHAAKEATGVRFQPFVKGLEQIRAEMQTLGRASVDLQRKVGGLESKHTHSEEFRSKETRALAQDIEECQREVARLRRDTADAAQRAEEMGKEALVKEADKSERLHAEAREQQLRWANELKDQQISAREQEGESGRHKNTRQEMLALEREQTLRLHFQGLISANEDRVSELRNRVATIESCPLPATPKQLIADRRGGGGSPGGSAGAADLDAMDAMVEEIQVLRALLSQTEQRMRDVEDALRTQEPGGRTTGVEVATEDLRRLRQEAAATEAEMGRRLQGLASRQELTQAQEALSSRLEEVVKEYVRTSEAERERRAAKTQVERLEVQEERDRARCEDIARVQQVSQRGLIVIVASRYSLPTYRCVLGGAAAGGDGTPSLAPYRCDVRADGSSWAGDGDGRAGGA
jgi:hypothetical protein